MDFHCGVLTEIECGAGRGAVQAHCVPGEAVNRTFSASPANPAPVPPDTPPVQPAARPRANPATHLALCLSALAGVALALLAAAALLAVQLHFEARDRALLHGHLEHARSLLGRVDNTAALSELPAHLAAAFGDQHALAVRVQDPLGQPMYEQAPVADMPPRLLARPAVAAPVPLVDWRQDDHVWRGSALLMRLALDGAAPLTVAMALDVGQDQAFVRRLGLVLSAYVLLMVPLLALLARWLVRRALRQAVD